MSKHTPGPWRWLDRGQFHVLTADMIAEPGDYPDEKKHIHDDGSAAGEYSPQIDVDGANGLLIAAAPELLEACLTAEECIVELLDMVGRDAKLFHNVLPQIRAAILKATEGAK